MKNIIRKTICSAMTAVTLSACVVAPSALNMNDSKISIVNSINAEAAFEPFYGTITVTGAGLRDKPNGSTIEKLWAFTPVHVVDYETVGRNEWYKVETPDGEGWVSYRAVDRCSEEEYNIRLEFAEGKRTAFVTNWRGVPVKASDSAASNTVGTLPFLSVVQLERLWPSGSDGIVWAQLSDGKGFIQINDGNGGMNVELLTAEQGKLMNDIYGIYRKLLRR
ncbi:hypothetical protein [Ruminococcus flavefaciens]|uniref:hypothetical protein n=1 Tax=Ruminococcus flavefaciens TaxID=1265 RepID=UPI0026F09742|nr:hypothetical protein [Ruminococcus flavefaciens]